jgi:hypothetical protein
MTKPTNDNDPKDAASPDRELSDKELQIITGAGGAEKNPGHPPPPPPGKPVP